MLLVVLWAFYIVAEPMSVKAKEGTVSRQVVDGVVYEVRTYVSTKDGKQHVTVKQSNSKDYMDLTFDSERNVLTKEKCTYCGKDATGKVKYASTYEKMTVEKDSATAGAKVQSITYNRKLYEHWSSCDISC